MKFICKFFSRIGVTFRKESNELSSTMIGYSDDIVIAPNYLLIMQLKVLLQYHNCGDYFVIKFYLISLISGQGTA